MPVPGTIPQPCQPGDTAVHPILSPTVVDQPNETELISAIATAPPGRRLLTSIVLQALHARWTSLVDDSVLPGLVPDHSVSWPVTVELPVPT